ncbi:sulfotransferase family protein [Cytobacillus sp. NCCP-133]|uniref:sulfotransferase family protein n=1 Tax=Cytobacillus sp. NCCP-133 TaxID=766848 RepID=UPI00222E1C62|nr:hypothetical protein [Cytobacillus sp. NCCP-133]GLB62112.1 hypothetical protein NCCP133_42410 [Cytobacillus sp. NCCP-133]
MVRENKAICILGSGRCGTSMVSRAINLMGVDVGSHLYPADRTNPKGYWENSRIVKIHEKMFKTVGNNIHQPLWWQQKGYSHLKEELMEYITSEYLDKGVWGWKDPRTCHFIELWNEVLNELGVTPHFVIMVRNPVDIVHSFKKAYNFEGISALKLWQQRTLLCIKKTKGHKRIIFDYNQFLDNSLECLKTISKTFNLKIIKNESELKKQLRNFIDPSLQHSRVSLERLLKDPNIDDDIKELYNLCYKACHSNEFFKSDIFSNKINLLYRSFFNELT